MASTGYDGYELVTPPLTDPKDPAKAKGLSYIRGAQPFATFKAQIDEALK